MHVELDIPDCDSAIADITEELKTLRPESRQYRNLYGLRDSYLTQRYMLMEEKNGCIGISADE